MSDRRRAQWSWALYDWANSPFFAVILTFLVLNRKRGGLPLPQMLLLFGGSQLPKLARSIGQAQKEFKDAMD